MIKDINNKNFVDAETKFQSVMNDKVADELARAKETLSKSLFNDEGKVDLEKAEQQKQMSVTFTQLKQTIDLAEKVKVDSGEKIVRTDKVGKSKKLEVTVSTKGGKFFVYFDGEKYPGKHRDEKAVDKIIKDYLKLVGEELQENRAKRDAMKAMGGRRGVDPADIDDTATDDDKKAANKNIMVQLRKVVTLRGMKPIEFADNKKAKIDPKVADKLLRVYQGLKPASKLQLQTLLGKSKRDFDKAVKQLKINEYFDSELDESKMKQMASYIDDIVNAMNKDRTLKPFAKKFKADASKSLNPKKSLEKILPDYIPGKQVAGLLNMGEEILSNDELNYIAEMVEEYSLTEALPPHLAKLFDKDGNFKDPKKQKVFDRMMGDGIGKEITQKMGRIRFRVDANSAKKKVMVYVDQNDEKDAQKALKNHPAYVSGALRVIPEGEFTPHVMYDPKTGKAYKAEKPEDHERMAKMGYTHEKPKEVTEAMKYKFVAVDTKGKIIGFSSKQSDAKDMARRNKGVFHKLKEPMSPKVGDMEINRPFNPVLKANVSFKDFSKNED